MRSTVYKSRRLTIGQNCSAVCTNKSGHRDTFLNSNERHEAPCVLRGLFSRPPSLEQSDRRDLFFVMPFGSPVVDSTFEQSENVTIARFLVMRFKPLLL